MPCLRLLCWPRGTVRESSGVTPPPAFGRPGAFPAPQREEPECMLPPCRIPNPLVKIFACVDLSDDRSARPTVSMLIVYAKRDRGQYTKRTPEYNLPRRFFPVKEQNSV